MDLSEITRVESVDPEAVARTKTPAALWQMLRSLEQRVASAEAEAGLAKLEARLATEAAEAAEATARAEKRAAQAIEQRVAVTVQTAESAAAVKADTFVAAALCQQRRRDWAAKAKAKAEGLQASAEPREKGAEPREKGAEPRRPLAPLTHHNHAASCTPATPVATHRRRAAATADRAAASPTDYNCVGAATGCNGRCGGLCTDGCDCGLWLQAPRPPTKAALPTTSVDGCGSPPSTNVEPHTAPLTGAHAKLRSAAQWLAPSPSAGRRLEFEPQRASAVRRRVGPSPRAAVVLLLCLLCYGGWCATRSTRSAPALQPCVPGAADARRMHCTSPSHYPGRYSGHCRPTPTPTLSPSPRPRPSPSPSPCPSPSLNPNPNPNPNPNT